MSQRLQYSAALAKGGLDTGPVDSLVRSIAQAPDESPLPALFEQLKTEAERLPWHWDEDYTARALQDEAVRVDPAGRRATLLRAALRYARWCASCATTGGEGLARSMHVREIETLLGTTAGR